MNLFNSPNEVNTNHMSNIIICNMLIMAENRNESEVMYLKSLQSKLKLLQFHLNNN